MASTAGTSGGRGGVAELLGRPPAGECTASLLLLAGLSVSGEMCAVGAAHGPLPAGCCTPTEARSLASVAAVLPSSSWHQGQVWFRLKVEACMLLRSCCLCVRGVLLFPTPSGLCRRILVGIWLHCRKGLG